MPEPATTTTAAVTLAAGSIAVPALTVAGIPLGLRPDILLAGFAGSLVAIILLNSVPSTGDTWVALLRTTLDFTGPNYVTQVGEVFKSRTRYKLDTKN